MGEEYLPWPYPSGRGGGDALTLSLRGFFAFGCNVEDIFDLCCSPVGIERKK